MRRTIAVVSALALTMSMMIVTTAAADSHDTPSYTEDWDGRRGTDSERCDKDGDGPRDAEEGWIHWVFATKGDSINATLTLGGTGSGIYEPGEPLTANTWHFYTPFFELEGLTASIALFGGESGTGGGLVISDYCPGEPFTPEATINVTKSAEASYDREVEWELEKTVDGESSAEFSGEPGDTFEVDWEVVATKIDSGPMNFLVAGEIEITYSSNVALPFTIEDVLDDGTVADVDCGGVDTIPIGADTITCTYEATPDDDGASENTVTVELDAPEGFELLAGSDLTDTVGFTWEENLTGDDEVLLEDERVEYSETISDTTEETFPETFECSTDRSDYGEDRTYEYTEVNTATLTGEITDLEASATVTVTCTWPLVFKGETATGAGPQWRLTQRAPNNWFEYTQFGAEPSTKDIITGAKRDVIGSVTKDGATFTFDLGDFELADVGGNVKIHPMTSCGTNQRYVQPGQFKYHFDVAGGESEFSVTLPGDTNAACYGIHLDVGRWVEKSY